MIIFLYGPDTYRSGQKLQEIVEHYKNPALGGNLDSCGIKKVHKSGLNLRYFNGQKLAYRDFKDEFQQTPMFKEKKLVILKGIFSNQEFKKSFLENAKIFMGSDDIILFHEEGKILQNDALFKFFKKNAKIQEFQLLGGQKLKNWAKKEFGKYKTEIEPGALDELVDFVGSDLWRLSNEIKKLAAFKNNKKIEKKDIGLLVRPKIETDIFKTIDAIALKNKKQALSLIHKHLEKGDSPLYLLHMINFQFRNLLIVKDLTEKHQPYDTALRASHLHPYVFKKSYWQAEKFTIEGLKKIYQKIFQVDLDVKVGKLEPKTALDLLIAEI